MASKYTYRFTEKAEQDLDEILHYISVDLVSPAAARNLVKNVFEQIELVRIFPHSGMLVDNEFLANKSVRKLSVDHYIIYYIADDEERAISIIRILYGKRDLEEILRTM